MSFRRPRKGLTDEEIRKLLLEIPTDSEDDLDSDSENDDDPDVQRTVSTNECFESDSDSSATDEYDTSNLVISSTPNSTQNVTGQSTSTNTGTCTATVPVVEFVNCRSLIWKKKNITLQPQNTKFLGDDSLPSIFTQMCDPVQFFNYYFPNSLIERITNETNLFSTQKNANKCVNVSSNEIRKFIGISLLTSIVRLPNVRLYWNETLGNRVIQNTMSLNRFEEIRKNLHFNDNNSQVTDSTLLTYDKLHKLRPVIEEFGTKFASVPMEENLSVDEQLCSTKARHHLKQYMPLKPHKWGYKLYFLCGTNGYAYNFEIYTGCENDPRKRLPEEIDLGASGNVVVRLCRNIPRNQNYKLYFDNFYNSPQLQYYMAKQGIFSIGTVKRNRVPGCKLTADKEMSKKPRGTSEEYVSLHDKIEISNVSWKDNRNVMFLSTYVGVEPVEKIDRYDRKIKTKVTIDCPSVVKHYNKHMGGVDLLDSLIGRYKITMRSKKWYIRIFYHLLDLSVINAWILYKRVHLGKGVSTTNILSLADFRSEVSMVLCQMGESITPKRGRPSSHNIELQYSVKRKRGPATYIPPEAVRHDKVEHMPVWNEARTRCKVPNCKAQSFIGCSKCGITLCLNKERNCFKIFHES